MCLTFELSMIYIKLQEVDEIMELLKSTWRMLGITQTIHDLCYTWVLFRQVCTRKWLTLFLFDDCNTTLVS